MLENHYMFVVGPFQMSLLFSRTSELQEVGSAQFRSCCKQEVSNSVSSRVINSSFFSSDCLRGGTEKL